MKLNRVNSAIDRNERNKINENFDILERDYGRAAINAQYAVETSDEAKQKAESVQTQFNQVVIEGDSSVEAAQARVSSDDTVYDTLKARLDAENAQVTQQLAQTDEDLIDRGFNLRNLGLPLDGSVAIQNEVMTALEEYKHVVVPPNAIIGIDDTLHIKQGQSLVGLSYNIRGYGATAKVKWIGSVSPRKAAVLIGKNAVGAEPILDATDIVLKNIYVDCDYKVGIGAYGTYLTNETSISNIVVTKSLEHNIYFAKAWYAHIEKIKSLECKNCGITLGMPLEYLDGTTVNWSTLSPIEMNNCTIRDLRSMQAGKHFSSDNPITFTPHDVTKRRKGYGIGLGVGNAFNVDTFLSEQSGGVGLYVYNSTQPIKNIKNGYLESNCLNSGLDVASEMTNILIESVGTGSDAVVLENIFTNFNSGGIYHTGTRRLVWLKNIHQPRFLKSLDGLLPQDLFSFVLKDNVYECGLYNALEQVAAGINVTSTHNTRYSFDIPIEEYNGFKLIYAKSKDGTTPSGSLQLNNNDNTTSTRSYPTLLTTQYTLVAVGTPKLTSLTRAGVAGTVDSEVIFKVVNTPFTNI